jgi:amidase
MARTVRDAAILLGALSGEDVHDGATQKTNGKRVTDYRCFLDKDGLKGKRIGIEKSHLKVHEGVAALYQ